MNGPGGLMAAITPAQAGQLTTSELEELTRFEDFFNSCLRENYNSGSNDAVSIRMSDGIPPSRLTNVLKHRYKTAGWDVTVSKNRDEWIFKAKA